MRRPWPTGGSVAPKERKIKLNSFDCCLTIEILNVGLTFFPVNGEYITSCNHDEAVNILCNAGDMVMLTVKHYRAATPFLQKNCK
jgi:hypothetical protein